ncbi:hypothetical protein [Planktothrix pseudagardhii]|uniref:Uncharacterized protein n=1 Tax=Planktothrix pseudagardhii TaxID=132604 RepID=A0A9W4G3E9_9CYAN|nr:hypothetical protein [Planktothrix pseudagardhii]CAD5919765.1 hypothetical protein NO713_00584 [Planktothrix pseudagardhii]
MDKQESLQDKFGKLFDTITNIPKKLADAVEDGLREPSNLVCVKDGLLDFEQIEDDVREIHRNLKARGDKVLGSHLILDDQRNLMEIRTYAERGNKTFVIPVDAEVRRVTNIPPDVLDELKKKGRIELSLKV